MRPGCTSDGARRSWPWLAPLLLALGLAPACEGQGGDQTDGGSDAILCQDRLDCPARLGCVDGVCGHCVRDRDCAVTEFCNPIERLCYPIHVGECVLNEDCALGSFCVQGTCRDGSEVVVCSRDADCAAGQRCDRLNLVCVQDVGCDRDEDCAEGEVCDRATERCVSACTPETEDVVCGFGLVCDEFGRCVECTSDAQCGVGLTCNPETNRCEGENSCITDRDCLAGSVCNPQTRQCTQAPPECLSNADCAEGMHCDPATGRCRPAECQPDAEEPNDEPDAAAVLEPGRSQTLRLCPGDQDWYRIELARADRLQVIVDTDLLAADQFSIKLFDPELTEALQEGSLLIDHVATGDGAYRLRTATSDPQVDYSLIVTVSRGTPCDDDAFEPNDAALSARPIEAGSYGPLALCPRDEDWFVFERPLDRRVEARIEFPALEGDLDLELLGGDGQTVIDRSATAGDSETVRAFDEPGTRYYLRVWAEPQVGNRYVLQLELPPR